MIIGGGSKGTQRSVLVWKSGVNGFDQHRLELRTKLGGIEYNFVPKEE